MIIIIIINIEITFTSQQSPEIKALYNSIFALK